MKPALESVQSPGLQPFVVRKFEAFSASYHFHPEIELTFIVKGSGNRYVGTNMSDFVPGDLVLLGPNLPHCWKLGEMADGEISESIVIQFLPGFAGEGFFDQPAMKSLSELLGRSAQGIRFTGDTNACGKKMLELLNERDGFKRVLMLLELLHLLSVDNSYILLENRGSLGQLSVTEQQRIHLVLSYLVENFTTSISLQYAASLANMTVPAFCKYFKKITRKTFVQSVIDYRVDYSARQLVHSSDSVSQIASDSGFNDISHFHKVFRVKMGVSPLVYRKSFLR